MGSASEIIRRIEALDPTLFASIESQTSTWDRKALLALHDATAAAHGSFTYLEVGSFRGGSLQAMIQDPRCARLISIDPRPPSTPDKRSGTWVYEANTTADMVAALARLPHADMDKLTTLDAGTDELDPHDLPAKPDLCFVDGEHTDEAALRDGRFCVEALRGEGVVAFHDYEIVQPGIREFLREVWPEIRGGVVFVRATIGGGVIAVEFGDRGILDAPPVRRAVSSGWHTAMYRRTSALRASPLPFFAAWSAMPALDRTIARVRASRVPVVGRRREA